MKSIRNDETVTVTSEKTMRLTGMYESESTSTVMSVSRYARAMRHFVR